MKNYNGFTLIELMLAVLVLAVVIGIAVPSMSTLIKNNQQTAKSNELIGLLSYARTEAVSQSTAVSICGSDNGATCNTSNWETGALVFKGVATAGTTPTASNILRVFEPLSAGTTLRRVGGANASFLRYDKSGRLYANDASAFKLCDERGATHAKGININSVGQIRSATDSDADGTVELISGSTLVEITCP